MTVTTLAPAHGATRTNVDIYFFICHTAGPFSHRTMLTLEEKGVPYNKLLLDENSIPEWCAAT